MAPQMKLLLSRKKHHCVPKGLPKSTLTLHSATGKMSWGHWWSSGGNTVILSCFTKLSWTLCRFDLQLQEAKMFILLLNLMVYALIAEWLNKYTNHFVVCVFIRSTNAEHQVIPGSHTFLATVFSCLFRLSPVQISCCELFGLAHSKFSVKNNAAS